MRYEVTNFDPSMGQMLTIAGVIGTINCDEFWEILSPCLL